MIEVEERKMKEREQEAHEQALKDHKSNNHGKGKAAPKKHDEEKKHEEEEKHAEEKKHIDQKVEPDKGKSARG